MNESDYSYEILKSIIELIKNAVEKKQEVKEFLNGLFSFIFDIKEFKDAGQKLLDNQIILTEDIPQGLEKEIINSENVADLIEDYFVSDNQNRLNSLINRCQGHERMKRHQELFNQVLDGYENGLYHLACMGLFAIADEIMTTVSGIYKPKDEKRVSTIHEIIQETPIDELDYDMLLAYFSLSKEERTFYSYVPFDSEEPTTLNRHWIMHGRSTRILKRIDFIRLLLWIDFLCRVKE